MSVGKRPQDQAPRPPARLVLTTWEHLVAFGFGAGLSPKAPGTVGTLWGVPVWILMAWLPWMGYVAVTAALFAFGVWLCGRSARMLGVHDSPGIVFDEVVGFVFAAAPLLPSLDLSRDYRWLIAAFVLFRIFDVWKPWPIGWLDRRIHGGFGIMLDDAVAGVYAAAVLTVILFVVPA